MPVAVPSMNKLKEWTNAHTKSEWIYIAATFIYLTSYLPFLPAYRAAESVLILIFLWLTFVRGRHTGLRTAIIRDPLFRLSLAMMFFLVIAKFWYAVSLPPMIQPDVRETRYFLKPVMVLLIALGFCITGTRYRWWLAGSAIAGFGFYLVTQVPIEEWSRALAGQRVDFGIHNAEHTSMFFGTTLLALLCFSPRIIIQSTNKTGQLLLSLFVGAAIAITLFGVVATQTRAAWIGLAIAGIAALVLFLCTVERHQGSTPKNRRSIALWATVMALVIGVTIMAFNVPERIMERFSAEKISIAEYTTLPEQQFDTGTSHGVRLASWKMSLKWLQERPLLGWGPGSADDLIDRSPYFSDEFKRTFGHLHSSFFESLVANGLVGSLILLAMIIWIGRSTVIAFREHRMPTDVFIFGLSFFGFWLTINMFESYVLYTTGHYIHAAVCGFIYSFYLQKSLARINL